MAFMQPEVLDKEEWAEIETNNGTSWVPFSVLSSSEAASARRGDFEPLLKYTEGTRVYNDQSRVRQGYGVRLSAPGYMDATEWEVYGSKKDALKRARQLAREAEGEDYATKKKSRGHATKAKGAFSNKQIGGYLQAAREPFGISENDHYNKATYGITKAEYGEINRAMHATYGMFPERTLAGVRKALAGGRHHATKQKEKRLHFAGYDFTSGPEGTVIHRPTAESTGFRPGDRVEYRDVNLWQQGTVTGSDGKWIMVRWDGKSFESREWAPNLRHVSTGAAHATRSQSSARQHATKKSQAQLDREIAAATGIGSWKKSDRPFNSEFLETGNASARVKPTSTYAGADYEWSIWLGPPGRRVLHQSGETKTRSAAKRIAQQRLAALR